MISAIVAFISVVTMMIVGSTIFYKQYRAQTDYENQMEQNNINDINDVRNTYTSKIDLSKSVNTADFTAKKAQTTDLQSKSLTSDVMKSGLVSAETMNTNKFISPGGILSELDASQVNASRMNLVGNDYGKGAINFRSTIQGANTGDYMMQRGVGNFKDDLILKTPNAGKVSFLDEKNNANISVQPSTGQVQFAPKWNIGKTNNKELDTQGTKYDMFGINFDNKAIAELYNIDGQSVSKFNSSMIINDDSFPGTIYTGSNVSPLIIGTSADFTGIVSLSDKPFNIFANEVQMGAINSKPDITTINDIKFANDLNDPSTNMMIDSKNKSLNISGVMNNNKKQINLSDNVSITGDLKTQNSVMRQDGSIQGKTMNSDGWVSGENLQGRTNIVAGDWAAVMRKDGSIQAKTMNSDGWVSGSNIQGRSNIVAGDWQAIMRYDGAVQGNTLYSTGWAAGQNVQGRDYVTAGSNWSTYLRSDGQVYGKTGLFDESINVGSTSIKNDGSITAKSLTIDKFNTPSGLQINGPLQLTKDSPFDIDNSRFHIGIDGKVGIGTNKPKSLLDVQGNVYMQGLSRQSGDTDMLRIQYDNANNPQAGSVGIFNGLNVAGGGGMYVGGFDKRVPDGTIQATGKIITPSITRNAGDTDSLRINYDNPSYPVAMYGSTIMGDGGLSVGTWATAPKGTIQATNQFCINTTCVTENDLKKVLTMNSSTGATVQTGAIAQTGAIIPATTGVPTIAPTVTVYPDTLQVKVEDTSYDGLGQVDGSGNKIYPGFATVFNSQVKDALTHCKTFSVDGQPPLTVVKYYPNAWPTSSKNKDVVVYTPLQNFKSYTNHTFKFNY